MLVSVFAAEDAFKQTTDFYRRLVAFNSELDIAKVMRFEDGRLSLVAVTPLRVMDKDYLELLLDQVGAANNSAYSFFQKDIK
jgi:hypothetical protein